MVDGIVSLPDGFCFWGGEEICKARAVIHPYTGGLYSVEAYDRYGALMALIPANRVPPNLKHLLCVSDDGEVEL